MLELLFILLAFCCAPYMLAGMLRLPPLPSPRQIWHVIAPVVEVIGYGLKRLLAYEWKPEEHERPRLLRGALSSVSLPDYVEPGADEADDEQTDLVFALVEAFKAKRLDRTRMLIIDTAILNGWNVASIRALVKGDTGAVGAEIEAARQRLGIKEPPRVIPIRDAQGKREMTI